MLQVTVMSKIDCPLCDKGIEVIKPLAEEFQFEIKVVDIYQDDTLLEKYQIMIPVVLINNEEVDFGILSREKIRKRLLELNGQI